MEATTNHAAVPSAAASSSGVQPPQRTGTKIKRSAFNRRRLSRSIALLLCAAVLITLLGNLLMKKRTYSDAENRSLASFPAFHLSALADGSWFSGLSDWYNDQFYARDSWISLHLSQLRLLGMQESGGVYLGKKGHLLADPETPDEAALNETLDAIRAFSTDHPELSTVMMVVPGAASIQKQYLPANAPARNQIIDVNTVNSALADTNIVCVDAASALSEHSTEYIYYKTDHHWTSLGAYYALEAAADALNIRDSLTDFDVCTVTDSFEGTLASKSGSHSAKDSIDIYFPVTDLSWYVTCGDDGERSCSVYSSAALEQKDKYQVFFGGNYSQVDIHTTACNGRVLLVFKDSYANCLIPMLLPCYERVIMIDPRYYYGSLNSFLNEGVTDVLYLYSADTLLTDTSLKDVLSAVSVEPAAEAAGSADAAAASDGSTGAETFGNVPAASAADAAAQPGASAADAAAASSQSETAASASEGAAESSAEADAADENAA